MRRIIPTRVTSAHAVAGVALFVALGGGAYAATGSPFIGPHGNINTCVPPGGGGVNVWKPGHRCTGGRVGLAFPVVGQPGATGQTGPTGLTGPTGATGAPNPSATTVDGQTVTKLLLKEPTPASGTTSMALYTGAGLTDSRQLRQHRRREPPGQRPLERGLRSHGQRLRQHQPVHLWQPDEHPRAGERRCARSRERR